MKKLLQPAGIGILSMILMMVILWPWQSDDLAENREIRLRNVGHQICGIQVAALPVVVYNAGDGGSSGVVSPVLPVRT